MKFELLNELAESRIFQYRDDFKNKSARELADLLFSTVLLLEILRHKSLRTAKEYAGRTINYGEFDGIRPGSTDLANLASVLLNQEKFDAEINSDRKISVPELQFKRYLRDLSSGRDPGNQDREFLLKLEDYLRVNDGELRNLRRIVAYWAASTSIDKKNAADQLLRGIRSRAREFDLHLLAQRVV